MNTISKPSSKTAKTMQRGSLSRRYAVLAGACTAALLAAWPGTAMADTPQTVDMDQVVQSALAGSGMSVDTSAMTVSNVTATVVGTPSYTALPDAIYMGTATLTNDSNYTETLTTQAVSKAVAQTVSTAVTVGAKSSTTDSVSASLSYGGATIGGSASSTNETSVGLTGTNASTVTTTYTAPSANITLPPHTTATVTEVLNQQTESGKFALHAEFGGWLPTYVAMPWGKVSVGSPYTPYTLLQGREQSIGHPVPLPAGVSLNDQKQTLQFDGQGIFTADIGTSFSETISIAPAQQPHASNQAARMDTAAPATRTITYTIPVTAKDVHQNHR